MTTRHNEHASWQGLGLEAADPGAHRPVVHALPGDASRKLHHQTVTANTLGVRQQHESSLTTAILWLACYCSGGACRLWLRWPLTKQMVSYAADDVRSLLPLAQRLLSAQAPALGALSTLAARRAMPQPHQLLLALPPELARRYAPLLDAAEQGDCGHPLLQCELLLGEGFAPTYRPHVPEQQGSEQSSSGG